MHYFQQRHFPKFVSIFLDKKKSGVIVLPSYCEGLMVPEDIEIELEAYSNGEE